MLKAASRQSVLFVLSAALSACGAPAPEEGTAPEVGGSEQSLTSALACTRNTLTSEITCTHSVTDGAAPFTYYWQTTETHQWDGEVISSGWYQGSNTDIFYCPRSGTRGEEFIWSLRIEVYAVDANGAVSTPVYRGFPCSVSGW